MTPQPATISDERPRDSAGRHADADEPGPSRSEHRTGGLPDIEVIRDSALTGASPDLAWLHRHLLLAVAQLDRPVARLAVRLVDDAAMRRLHRQSHGLNETTDVLTWLLSAPGEPNDADIAVCEDEAARRATELGHSAERELLLYVIHGLLHCAGHDDHDPAGAQAMHEQEDRILTAIGVGPTFAPGRKGQRL